MLERVALGRPFLFAPYVNCISAPGALDSAGGQAVSDGGDLDWTDDGPRSRRFDDVYFSAVDGLTESRAVFLAGCGLPEAWANRDRFVVGELGFGTGLNVLALLDLWRHCGPAGARLHIFSVEAYPLTGEEAARALGAWPELTDLAAQLLALWPDDRLGFHRLMFTELNATLDLWIGDAADGLAAWSGAADAWFLDGFAPARNPLMWRQAALDLVARRSRPGARLATFTVAGTVRRGLVETGFSVEKRPGFGRKRERLEGRLDRPVESRRPRPRPARIVILGAGVAGAALARALEAEGVSPLVIDESGPGAGASGNPVALISPRLDAGFGPSAQLHAQAFAYATALYKCDAPDAIIAKGALQLEGTPRDAGRYNKIAPWRGFATGALSRLTAEEARLRLEEPSATAGLAYAEALTLTPQPLLERWLSNARTIRARIARLSRDGDAWRLWDDSGGVVAEADAVLLAAGPACLNFLPEGAVAFPLQAVRGQANWTAAPATLGQACAWGGYAIPMADGGVLFGSTHLRDDWGTDLRDEDTDYNLHLLRQGRPRLAAQIDATLAGAPLQGRASLRAATPDQMPLAGEVGGAEGLYILSGLGARGWTLAPLLAEHVTATMLDAPSPLPNHVITAILPTRFCDK